MVLDFIFDFILFFASSRCEYVCVCVFVRVDSKEQHSLEM